MLDNSTNNNHIDIYKLNQTELIELRKTFDLISSISNFDFQMELMTEFFNDFHPKITQSEFCKIMNSIN